MNSISSIRIKRKERKEKKKEQRCEHQNQCGERVYSNSLTRDGWKRPVQRIRQEFQESPTPLQEGKKKKRRGKNTQRSAIAMLHTIQNSLSTQRTCHCPQSNFGQFCSVNLALGLCICKKEPFPLKKCFIQLIKTEIKI